MTRRLAAYRAGQPPRTVSRAAMPDKVSPGCTTYPWTGRRAFTAAAATLAVLARVISVVLLAMRMFAWAGRTGWLRPDATATITRMLSQASTAHADFVHTRTVRHFPS